MAELAAKTIPASGRPAVEGQETTSPAGKSSMHESPDSECTELIPSSLATMGVTAHCTSVLVAALFT